MKYITLLFSLSLFSIIAAADHPMDLSGYIERTVDNNYKVIERRLTMHEVDAMKQLGAINADGSLAAQTQNIQYRPLVIAPPKPAPMNVPPLTSNKPQPNQYNVPTPNAVNAPAPVSRGTGTPQAVVTAPQAPNPKGNAIPTAGTTRVNAPNKTGTAIPQAPAITSQTASPSSTATPTATPTPTQMPAANVAKGRTQKTKPASRKRAKGTVTARPTTMPADPSREEIIHMQHDIQHIERTVGKALDLSLSAYAVAELPQATEGRSGVSLGLSSANGKVGEALGYSANFGDEHEYTIKISVSHAGEENAAGVGIGYQW